MKATNSPFTEKEIEIEMQTAFNYVKMTSPDVTGLEWEKKIKESLRLQYAKGIEANSNTYSAYLFADIIFECYYEY